MNKFLLTSLILLSSLCSFSQSTRVIRFDVIPTDEDKKALIRWTMDAGSTCLDFVVERSADNLNFQEVYFYPGVCGDEEEEVSYSWIDPSPIQFTTSYYRLKLDQIEFSLVSELILSSRLGGKEILSYPNPSNGAFTIEFLNPKRQAFTISVFSPHGIKIFEEKETSGNFRDFNLPELERGVYYINVNFEDASSFATKLIMR